MSDEVDCKTDRYANGDASKAVQSGEEYGAHHAVARREAVAGAQHPKSHSGNGQSSIVPVFDPVQPSFSGAELVWPKLLSGPAMRAGPRAERDQFPTVITGRRFHRDFPWLIYGRLGTRESRRQGQKAAMPLSLILTLATRATIPRRRRLPGTAPIGCRTKTVMNWAATVSARNCNCGGEPAHHVFYVSGGGLAQAKISANSPSISWPTFQRAYRIRETSSAKGACKPVSRLNVR